MGALANRHQRLGVLKYETISYIAILMYFLYSFSRTLYSTLGIGNNIFGYIILLTGYIALMICIFMHRSRALLVSIGLVGIIFIITLFSYLFHPENGNIITKVFAFQYGLSIVPFVCLIRNKKEFERVISLYASITFASCILNLVPFFKNGGFWITTYGNSVLKLSYNMTLGYGALVSGLLFFWIYKEKKHIIILLISLFCILISLIWGSRGCLLCYAIYLALYLFSTTTSKRLTRSIIFSLIFFVFLFFIGIDNILILIARVLSGFGLSSRTIGSLGTLSIISNDSGRRDIWGILLNQLWEKPFAGFGILGDRAVLNQYYSDAVTLYSHNVVLEILVSFGIPLGLVIIITTTARIIKCSKLCINTDLYGYFICLLSYNLGNLMVSNTLWYSTGFWFFIGFIILVNHREIIPNDHRDIDQ
jgi:hypothetical protein